MAVRLELEDKFQVGQDPEGLSHCDIVNSHLPPGVQVCGGAEPPSELRCWARDRPTTDQPSGWKVCAVAVVCEALPRLSPLWGAVVGVLDDRRSVV
ncbi:MAG: hypothetical protein WDW36_008311 [Sanguina aurantia]